MYKNAIGHNSSKTKEPATDIKNHEWYGIRVYFIYVYEEELRLSHQDQTGASRTYVWTDT